MADPASGSGPVGASAIGAAEDEPEPARARTPADRVEQRLQVTSPRMWLTLAGFVVLIVGGVVWGVLGRAADEVAGVGVMLPTDGLYDLASPVSGTVEGLLVQTGDDVGVGELIVSVAEINGRSREIRSEFSGTVVSMLVKRGTFLTAGAPVAVIEPAGSDLQVVLYVPAGPGKQIQPGMPVFISPSTTQSSQYGSMIGTVAKVSGLTVSAAQLDLTLGPDSPLVDPLIERGPALEVEVTLQRADTASGFSWTASDGPDFAITSGTLVDASVVIAAGSPASQILGG